MAVKDVRNAINAALSNDCTRTMSKQDSENIQAAAAKHGTGKNEAKTILRALEDAVILPEGTRLPVCADDPSDDSFFMHQADFNGLARFAYDNSKVWQALQTIDGVEGSREEVSENGGIGLVVALDQNNPSLVLLQEEVLTKIEKELPGWENVRFINAEPEPQ
jgi:hypothetical protein